MQDFQLSVTEILRHGQRVHGPSQVVTVQETGYKSASFNEVASRAERLAKALEKLGIRSGDPVGTFCWNHQAHLEAYLGIPSMGAVIHTLNIRLFAEHLVYVINHAEDKVILVDRELIPLLERIGGELKTVQTLVVIGDSSPSDSLPSSSFADVLDYETLLAAEEPGYDWPAIDELQAACICYTSGTTGGPKGVVYSHRSTYLHTMGVTSASNQGLVEGDRVLVIVPMFHANAWGGPYGAWMSGADMIMPDKFMKGEDLLRALSEQRVTSAAGVPTIWNEVLRAAERSDIELSSLRFVLSGGAAVPRSLIEAFRERFGVTMRQGWGMTETSPLAALAIPPANGTPDEDVTYSSKTGRVVAGVQMRVVGPDGQVLPNDGLSVGELEVRGPWITGSYFKEDDSSSFHDGWLRTGDVGHLDELGFMQITDRTKDVIKSGGEWISSVELEGLVAAHPDVFEAAVIATPDERWSERPLVCVVLKEGRSPSPEALAAFLADKVASWQVPEYWAFVDEIPKTSVGKFNKLALRALNAAGEIQVNRVEISSVVPSTQSGGAVAEPSIPGTPLDAQSRGAR